VARTSYGHAELGCSCRVPHLFRLRRIPEQGTGQRQIGDGRSQRRGVPDLLLTCSQVMHRSSRARGSLRRSRSSAPTTDFLVPTRSWPEVTTDRMQPSWRSGRHRGERLLQHRSGSDLGAELGDIPGGLPRSVGENLRRHAAPRCCRRVPKLGRTPIPGRGDSTATDWDGGGHRQVVFCAAPHVVPGHVPVISARGSRRRTRSSTPTIDFLAPTQR
jgi:hypothetical protein